MAELTIDVESLQIAETIEAELLKSLANQLPQARNSQWVLAARDAQQELIGGLAANTSYGWMLIKTLWVDQDYRRQGIGMTLVETAEIWARTAGCHAVWLDTSNPESLVFYTQLGYATFGELANLPGQFPAAHQRWFLRKSLKS